MSSRGVPAGPRRARPRVPKGARPVYLGDADSERLLSMVLALAAEVSVLSEELDTLREVLAGTGEAVQAALDSFEPSDAATERRARRRRALIRRMLRIVLEDLDGPAAQVRRARYQELIRDISA